MLFLALGAQAAVYVKADATGDNNGTSWTDAYTSLQTALTDHLNDGEPFFIAQGVYKMEAAFSPTGDLTLYGGFKGDESGTVEEMLAARDWDAYETIITEDLALNDIWQHVVPAVGEYRLPDVTDTVYKIIQDGKVFIPEPVDDYDMYCMKLDYGNYRASEIFKMSTTGALPW